MFLVNSRLGPFAAAPRRFPGEPVNAGGRPFSLSYGTIMPSSLTMVAPIASECSSYPPVSVLVRAAWALPRDFSRRLGIRDFALGLVSRLGIRGDRISLGPSLRAFTGTSRTPLAYPSPSSHRS